MSADDDNFDIDIYGEDAPQEYQQTDARQDDATAMHTDSPVDESAATTGESKAERPDQTSQQDSSAGGAANGDLHHETGTQQISSTGGSTNNQVQIHKQAPRQQGMKRKQGDDDDRPTDPGATAALMINDLNWWVSEEDIRGWANQSGCEDELIEVTFNEHKVNGKSKGQVYVQLQSPQAATALKHQLETLYKDQAHAKKPSAVFNPPHINPFKTLPKDVPAREKNRGGTSSGNFGGNQGGGGGNFGRFNNRGNFNNRGGNMGFQNRNFSGAASGNMGGNMGGYGGQGPMNNFGGGPMGSMNNFSGGGFNNRGGIMGGGMRGGMNNRGGRGGNMGMNNMGGMNMPMGGNMMGMGPGMMGMGGNMGMMGGMGGPGGFGGNQPQFNPGFFNQNQGGNDGNWNPHGAKRPRPE